MAHFHSNSLGNAFKAQDKKKKLQQQIANRLKNNATVVIEETIEEPVTPRIVIEETIIEDTSVPEQGGNSIASRTQGHGQIYVGMTWINDTKMLSQFSNRYKIANSYTFPFKETINAVE